MATLIVRNPSTVSTRSRTDEWAWDPFLSMRELLGWTPWTAADLPPAAEQSFVPRFDVHETAGEIMFRADLPGIQQKDLDITLTANQLRIAGRREATKHEENEHSYLAEREYGAFERVFTLPEGVDGEKVQATMNDGVLSLVVPKKPETQPRQIPITVPKA
ncbi:MAG: Hsp20/alpha crystallin family protein [Polyangia bacterium]|jgi:HSP20 family protein